MREKTRVRVWKDEDGDVAWEFEQEDSPPLSEAFSVPAHYDEEEIDDLVRRYLSGKRIRKNPAL